VDAVQSKTLDPSNLRLLRDGDDCIFVLLLFLLRSDDEPCFFLGEEGDSGYFLGRRRLKMNRSFERND